MKPCPWKTKNRGNLIEGFIGSRKSATEFFELFVIHEANARRCASALSDRSGLGAMTDNLNVVTVRPNDEGRIVIGMVVRPNPRGAVVFASGSESLTIELVYLTSTVCRKGDVKR